MQKESALELAFRKTFCLLIAMVLLSTNFSIAFAETTAAPADSVSNNQSFACSTEKLDDKERQRLWDETLKKGFVGKELNSGTKPNTERNTLDNNVLITPDADGELALKQTVPSLKIKPEEIQHLLNNYSSGAFSFGLETNDSLRVGRCKEIDGNCALLGEQLSLRNSGTGIVTDVKNVFSDLSKTYGLEDTKETVVETTSDILSAIKGELIDANNTDKNISAKVARRIKGKLLPNSILTDSFYSSMNSNCSTSDCIISSYSMFDKLYNSYFSTEMLFSNFGPTLLGQTKRAFGWTTSRFARAPGAPLTIPIGGKEIPLSLKETKFYKRLKSSVMGPDKLLTQRKAVKLQSIVDRYALETDKVLKDGQIIIQGGTFNANVHKVVNAMMKDAGDVPEKQRAVWQYLKELRDYADGMDLSQSAAKEQFDLVAKGLSSTDEAYKAAKRAYAGKIGLTWDWADDTSGIDIPEWFANHKSIKWNKYAVKTQTGDFVQPAVDSHYMDRILRKFSQTGDFSYTADDMPVLKTIFENSNGKLALYQVTAQGKEISDIGRDTLEEVISKGHLQDAFAKLDDGTFVPFDKSNLNYIVQNTQGNVKLYKGGWEKTREFSGDELADIIAGPRAENRIGTMKMNTERLLQVATEKGYYNRETAGSLLEKAMVSEKNIIKTYLSPKGGAKWTVYPYAYWGAKRGFGNEELSAYQLPDSWKTMSVELGEQSVYNDAFIDYFSNEGSDQGDVFNQVLNKLPWKMGYDAASNLYKPLREILDKFTRNEVRSTVGNLAIYVSGSSDCQACGMTLDANNNESFSPFFYAPQRMDSYLLEDTPPNQKKVGQTLIAYTRHTNIKGKTNEIQNPDGINLVQAIKNKETCADKVSELNLGGIPLGKAMNSIGLRGASVAGALAFGETLGYATIWWAGVLGSVLQQVIIAPQLQDCVDTEEGYYIHFFAPAVVEEKTDSKDQNPAKLSTQKVTDLVNKGKESVSSMFSGTAESWTTEATDKAKESIESLINNATENNVVEALLRTDGYSSGQFKGIELFYLWMQGGSELNPTAYRTQGKSIITDGNTNVEIDFKTGTVFVNGKPVITNPDIARLYSINTAIPAGELPNTITKISLPTDTNTLVFQMTIDGELFVLESSVLDCLKKGVEEQTGVGLSSNDLTEVFGKVKSIVTDSHPNVYVDLSGTRIVAEGRPRKIAEGQNSRVDILSNRDTQLFQSLDNDPAIGKLQSIQFKNGFILFKPETNELIVWLKHNEKAILEQNDVAGLRATKTTAKNPETGCEEPAIDLQAVGIPESELSQSKVAMFNQGMDKMGPFQIFDTPTKRFILYSKLENGECRDYFKVIDKNTGEVLVDQPIDSIEQTPNGIRITTADGKTHDLAFSAENGRPIINYNGIAEPLQSAQGQNGAFWFDPEKGQWYAENAQLLPLLEAFKNKGIMTQANPNGTVNSVPGGNPLNINIGQGAESGFNLPSLPENILLLLLYLLSLVAVIATIRNNLYNKLPENNKKV